MTSFSWKFLPGRSWANTNGAVDSCDWIPAGEHAGECAGHYQVKFHYQAGPASDVSHGEFCHEGIRHIAPYAIGERLAIQYDPKRPSRYHFSGASANYEKLEAIVVVTVFALLAGYFLYAY
jgi:hypothetical protein